MANTRQGNLLYIDTTGSISTDREIIQHLIFTPGSANDTITLGADASTPLMTLEGPSGTATLYIDFERAPAIFPNGIYATISSGAVATLILQKGGG